MEPSYSVEEIHNIKGTVVYGRGIGKLVGVPTANLKIIESMELPQVGVYISRVLLQGQEYCGVTHIGTRPTVDRDKEISVETHILSFNRDIYGEEIKIQLFKKLRLPVKFENFTLLLNQIRLDCVETKHYFGMEEVSEELHINIKGHHVVIDDREIYLSNKEFDVLYLLYANPDIVFTKDKIYEYVWHEPSNGCCHAVENTVFQIRKKIKQCPGGREFIKTVPGCGYKFISKK